MLNSYAIVINDGLVKSFDKDQIETEQVLAEFLKSTSSIGESGHIELWDIGPKGIYKVVAAFDLDGVC